MPPVSKQVTFKDGSTLELFYIGALATALGRTVTTVRKWEISGTIPETCFKDPLGKRLYSQEQIDAIVRCAEKAKIKQGAPLKSTSFSTWVHKELKEITLKYQKNGG